MKSIQVELPDEVARKLQDIVKAGWFKSERELVRLALAEFVQKNRFELAERFQLEDIDWALQH